MKKLYMTTLILFFAVLTVFGQNLVTNGDFENWTGGAADNWLADGGAVTITQNSATVQNGESSCEVLWTSQENQYLTSDAFAVTPGIEINASFWAYDNEIAGRARLCITYEGAENYYGDYSSDMDEWQQLTYTELVPEGASTAQFQIRFYDISGDWDGDATIIVDNVVFEANTTVNPEPTNYPTNFAGVPSGTKIVTTWTDAVGEQLPLSYLVLGNNDGSTIAPPVDGTPVANDMNWDDGMISMNVQFGVETLSISVDPNVEYTFTIFPFSNTGDKIDYKTDGTPPAVTVTSSNISTANQEGFDADLGTWTGYSVVGGDQAWEWADYGVPPGCAKMNGFAGAPMPNEDWLISPSINLANYASVSFSFDQARNYASNEGLFVLISTDYDGSSDPSTTGTWNDVTSMFAFPDPGSWNFMPAGDADVTMYKGVSTYFAFKYTSTDADASTWEIDNALVYGVVSVGIFESSVKDISMYPNPATDKVNLRFEQEGSVSIVNLAGQTVYKQEVSTGKVSVSIENLPEGLYMIQFIGTDNSIRTGKLMVK